MRFLTPAALALALTLALHVPGRAQLPKVRIDDNGVRVGFSSTEGAGAKTGTWAPVYVALTAGTDRVGSGDGFVVVETTDSDDAQNRYLVPLPPMEPKEQRSVVAYVRTGTTGSEIEVTVQNLERTRVLAKQRAGRTTYSTAPPGSFLYVTAGGNAASSLVGLHRALRPEKAEGDPNQLANVAEDPNSLIQFASIGQVGDLPTRWFGYSAADVLILETGSKPFTETLLNDKTNRKEALAEWVRRGGRLVISVGREHQLANALLEQLHLIPCTLEGTVQRPNLNGVSQWVGNNAPAFVAHPPKNKPGEPAPPIELVKIKVPPGRGVETLVNERDEKERDAWPVIVQASAGLGRVILVGFDLDQPPFTDWEGRAQFWRKLNSDSKLLLAPNFDLEKQRMNQNNNPWGGGGPGWDNSHSDVGTLMVDRLESFTEVPVISFGWVALFILVYIVVVGPLDYFFLKKVVKRLELTWITFPAVVLVVSAVAYISAYYLKGNDLRINKVDLIDIVAEPPDANAAAPGVAVGSRAYGTTWFTIFSPRIQNYTVGVEPGTGTWVPEVEKGAPPNPHSAVVTWMGRPENAWGGTGRGSGSQGFFRRPYDYAEDASGLVGVPIQVWSTKTFSGSWQAALPEDKPLVRAELKYTESQDRGNVLTGTITSELPVPLNDAVLFYKGTRYDLKALEPGKTRKLDPAVVVGAGGVNARIDEWFADVHVPVAVNPWQRQNRGGNIMQSAAGIMKDLMFGFKDTSANHPHNATLRHLDESWRLNRPDEAVVVGQLARLEQAGEQVSQDPASPSRIWLGQLPEPGKARPPLPGKMTQEAYVRIFIPVTTTK
jgi:hypothetical protein